MSARVLEVMAQSAGGIARHVAHVTEALDGNGIAIDIAAPPDLPIAMPKEVIPLGIPAGAFGHRAAVKTLGSIVRNGSYDVVHAHGLRAGIDAGRACHGSGKLVVTTIHNLVRPEVAGAVKAILYRPAERLVVRRSDRVLAVSRDIADTLRRSSRDDSMVHKIEVLYLGVGETPPVTRSAAEIRAELRADGPLIVSAARLSRQKALHVLIDALAQMTPDVTAAVVGQGPLEGDLRAQAERLDVSDRFHLLGWRDDAASVIAAGDVFTLSSVWEGVPLAAQEAILLGTPVVATDVGGLSELIVDRVGGRLVPSGDATALARALEGVIENNELAGSYVDGARRTLTERFSTEKMLQRLREIYTGARVAD